MVPVLLGGGLTVIPGSTLGGVIVPFCCDSRWLMFPEESGGTIFSGGVVGAAGGGTAGTVGLFGPVADGFCASTGSLASESRKAAAVPWNAP